MLDNKEQEEMIDSFNRDFLKTQRDNEQMVKSFDKEQEEMINRFKRDLLSFPKEQERMCKALCEPR